MRYQNELKDSCGMLKKQFTLYDQILLSVMSRVNKIMTRVTLNKK
jgi:hypothetical protein